MTAVLGCVAVSSMQDVAHMVGEVRVLLGSGEEVEAVPGKQRRKDCEGAKTGWTVLGHYKSPVRMVFCANPKAMCLQIPVHNVERLVPGRRVEVGQVRDRVAIALLPRPQRLTATIAVSPACGHPSRRQMFCVILVGIADQQASRVPRWRAAIGGCCANATGLSKGAMG